MKQIIIFLGIFLTACSAVDASAMASYGTEYPTATAQAQPTVTVTPTATIDHATTAQVAITQLAIAQATADEARRLNTQATAEFEQRQQAQLQMTAESERQDFAVQMLTATMAGTSIPLTQTQQAILNTQIPAQQTLIAGQMTATHEAPTQIVALSKAENQARYGPAYMLGSIWAMACIGLFMFSVSVFMLRRSVVETPKPREIPFIQPQLEPRVYAAQPETVVTLRTDNGGGFTRTEKMFIPCRPDQFAELCEGILSTARTLAINVWEGANEPFTRGEFMRVRNWLQMNKLAQSAGGGQLILTADGETLFRAWMDNHALPEAFKFENGE